MLVIDMFSNITNIFETKYKKLSFEDIQFIIQYRDQYVIINTMTINEQDCLIKYTVPYQMEEKIINDLIANCEFRKKIIIYGKNTNDESVEKKYKQLIGFGFLEVYLYVGGMFEWMLLQDIYGKEEFPTTTKVLDILRYKPVRTFGNRYLEY
jgi:hypothetical protein